MGLGRFPDNINLLTVLAVLIAILLAFIEAGYRLGIGRSNNKAQISQVRAIMGASLGLLAFMLAFAFSSGQAHFETRTEALVYETNVLTQAYRSADILAEPARSQARQLLRNLADQRIATSVAATEGRLAEVEELVRQSEATHEALWRLATRLNQAGADSIGVELFTSSVVELMSTHTNRLEAAVYNRIPPVIWLTLLFMASLSMLIMGYQGGLSGARSQLATWTLAVAFSAVIVLIMDLDRPIMSLFDVNNQIMLDLRARMGAD